MKRNIIILLLLIMFSISSVAQSRSSLSVTVGLSQPVGKFAQKDSASIVAFGNATHKFNGSGMAKLGYNISGEYQYRIKKNFGLVLKFRWQQNSISSSAVKEYLLTNNSWATTCYVKISKWSSFSLLAGGYYLIPLNNKNKLDLKLKLLIGALKTSVPARTFAFNNFPEPNVMAVYAVIANKPLGVGFAFLTGTGLAYHLSRKLDLLANIEYSDAFPQSPTYHTIIMSSNGIYSPGSSYRVDIDLSTINLNIGASIKF